ncbi:MAG: PilZ domain-containing protein [Desulforhopalus sp.]|nr:PilZ domain-containing protein [Desulforhopalus sp.]
MDTTEEKERRQELRQVDRRYLVFYLRIYDGMSNKIIGHLVDLSEKGMMLISDHPVPVNEDYRLRMRLPAQMKDRGEIVLAATSRWCKSDENPDFYLVGFQMHDLEPPARNLISTLLRDFGYIEGRNYT